MKAGASLLANQRSRGSELETAGVRVRWRPAFLVTAPLLEAIRFHKGALIMLPSGPEPCLRCSSCRWSLEARRRCPKWFDRLCVECSIRTGCYFVVSAGCAVIPPSQILRVSKKELG